MGRGSLQVLLVLALILTPLAAGAAADGDGGGGASVVSGSDVLRMVLTLGMVLGAILLVAWMLRRAGGIGGAARGIKVVASASVGQRERVVLVDVGGQQLLVGVAPGSVRLLESFDEAVVSTDTNTAATGDFGSRLRNALARQEGTR